MSSDDAARWRFHDDAAAFLDAAADHLAAHPVATTVVLTVADELRRLPPPPVAWPRWYAVGYDEAGQVAGVAMRTSETPPHAPYVAPMPPELAAGLGAALARRGEQARGLNGEVVAARACAQALADATGGRGSVEVGMTQRLYEHRDVAALGTADGVPGRWRRAAEADLPLLRAWLTDFHPAAARQAGRPPAAHGSGPAMREESLRDRVDSGRLRLWEVDGEPVSLAGTTAVLHGVGRVGPVYTPGPLRGRGYAAAATAAATRSLLDAGARPCLFADAANPTSNALYERLGYVAIGDFAELRIEAVPGVTTPAPA
ncbi:GNAT family N-acetyltransferase [Nocardioides sp.]|uniref:GNAT family N-acetyltransferase n=1 Tax=Nocardioides sp. TaxID=35761 RepID=UPI003518C66A